MNIQKPTVNNKTVLPGLININENKYTIVTIWRENMLGYLPAGIICSEKWTVFQERSSRETVSYEEQIISKDKYLSIFSSQMEAFVCIILQIFFATRAIFKIGEYLTTIHQSGGG